MRDASPIDRALALFQGKQRRLAEAAGVSQSAISQAISAGRVSPELAVKIEIATDGEVKRSELRPDMWPTDGSITQALAS